MRKNAVIFLGLLISFLNVGASNDSIQKPRLSNSFYFECFGNGYVYSLNYNKDFDINEKSSVSIRLGFAHLFPKKSMKINTLDVVSEFLYSYGNNKRVELGTGVTYFYHYYRKKIDQEYDAYPLLFLRAGYRQFFLNDRPSTYFRAGVLYVADVNKIKTNLISKLWLSIGIGFYY